MSTQNCNRCTNPLLRDGTSQPQRFFPELEPAYVAIDERTTIDLIEFSRKYAEKIRFWELDNATTGNWINFIENDIATLHAIIARKDVERLRVKFNEKVTVLLADATPDPNDFQDLINDCIALAVEMDGWLQKSLPDYSLHTDLIRIIQSQAAPNLRILAAYDRGAQLTFTVTPTVPAYPLPYSQLSTYWGDFLTVLPDSTIYTGATDYDRIQSGTASIVAIYESMINALEKLAHSATLYFDEIIAEFPGHQAHFTLMLAFFQLFQHPQDYLNQLTKRHLDFYYKEVLQMMEKKAVPDQVHLVFEVAKNIESHLVAEGTLFKAGKDETGKDILFSTDRNVIINKAKVDKVKNVFLHRNVADHVNYIFASPVADSEDGNGEVIAAGGWKLFGEHQKEKDSGNNDVDIDPRSMNNASVGFAIASPELLLKEGERTVTIELQFEEASFVDFLEYYPSATAATAAITNTIAIYFSGEEDWIMPRVSPPVTILIDAAQHFIRITTGLLVEQPAVVAYNRDALTDPFVTEWPVAKILFSQANNSVVYQSMQHLKTTGFTISVGVKEAVSLVLANDNGTLDPSKPFEPFGTLPRIGSNFYIGSTEIFSKKLTELSVTMEWQNVPGSNLADYYATYKKGNSSVKYINHNKDFSARLKLLDQYRWWDLIQETHTYVVDHAQGYFNDNFHDPGATDSVDSGTTVTAPTAFLLFAFLFRWSPSTKVNRTELFNHLSGEDPRLPKTTTIGNDDLQVIPSNNSSVVVDKTFKLLTHGYRREASLQKETITEYTNSTKRGFIRFELLSPGFLHDVYPKIQVKQAMALAKAPSNDTNPPALPNEPYTPTIRLLGIDYKSEHTVNYLLPEFQDYENREEQLFQVGPFGVAEVFPVDPLSADIENPEAVFYSAAILPKFIDEPETETSPIMEGVLYIGIRDLEPPRSLSLFFQLDEGTENPDLDIPAVTWSYLANNQWIGFDARQIIYDSTNGLVNSGIIEFSIPRDITDDNTILDPGLHWLRVQAPENTAAFSNVLYLGAQAVSATYADSGNDPGRLRTSIPASTISKLVKRDFAIKTVGQPFPSFAGKIEEQSNEFYARAAERLRHKNRAITIRDYEHLVLEAFPEIYKVKCINHTSVTSENAPGSVSVITVLDPKLRNVKNPFELKVSKADLETIKRFLLALNCTFVDLDVRNPSYEKIELVFNVIFRKEFGDETFYRNLLADDIRRFLSPWAFGDDTGIVFGGRIEKSVILNFIEERPYVDYVTDFEMNQYVGSQVFTDIEEAVARTSSSILITNDTHFINNKNS